MTGGGENSQTPAAEALCSLLERGGCQASSQHAGLASGAAKSRAVITQRPQG